LKNAKQIENKVKITDNGKVTSEYFLTKETRIRKLWQINEKIKTKRETKSISHQHIHNKKSKTKAFLLITYYAAFGYEYPKIKNTKPELGEALIIAPNKSTIEQVYDNN
jgi:hypothetical protein